MRALIVEPGQTRGALAATRALRAAGWRVGIGTPSGRGLAASSRCAERAHRVPGPAAGVDDFVAAVAGAVREGGYEVVFGGGDAELLALSARRLEVSAAVPYAAHERVLRAVDKQGLAAAARSVGLAVPRTFDPQGEEFLARPGPFVVKARLHAPPGRPARPGRRSRIEASIAPAPLAARVRATEIDEAGGEPVVQELVAGRLVAFTAVTRRSGEVVAAVQQEAERTWPPRAGISARARTVPVEAGLAAGCEALLRELGWFGLAQLQFILPPDGEPRLIDLNARFYGSLSLAVGAGVNLPSIWAALATRREPPLPARARAGVSYQWGEGDLRTAIARRREGIAGELWSCVRSARISVEGIWRADDPVPALRHAIGLTGRATQHGRRRLRGGGLFAISGLDGSGKSSQAGALAAALRERGIPAEVVWTSLAEHPRWLRALARAAKRTISAAARMAGHTPRAEVGPGAPRGSREPAKAIRRSSGALTFAWSMLLSARLALRVARATWPRLLRGGTVVCDRYTLDALAHLRYQYGEEREYRLQGALLRAFSPSPRRAFLLDVSPSTAAERAAEYTPAQNARRARAYRELAVQTGALKVDGERARDEVGAELAREAFASLNGQAPAAARRDRERSYSSS